MITDDQLRSLEVDVDNALRSDQRDALHVLGYGEISLVLGWPASEPVVACKRLPPFPAPAGAAAYVRTLGQYLEILAARGVDVVDTEVRSLVRDDGTVAVYCVQPVLPAGSIATDVARVEPDRAPGLFGEIVERVVAVTDETVGFDAQLSNWAVRGDDLVYFDITTPLLRRPDGSEALDTGLFLASLPWLLRYPVARFVVPDVIERYHQPRTVLLDLAANLVKERLDEQISAVLAEANRHVAPPLTEAEVRADYRSDARTWAALQALRRVDRGWQRRVRRRPYPFLLPERIER